MSPQSGRRLSNTGNVAWDVVRASARAHEPDFYLTALMTPKSARNDLVIWAAFTGEVRRILLEVSEPALAEIKLQWWRDTIGNAQAGGSSGSPIADALNDMMKRRHLDKDNALGILDAQDDLLATGSLGEEQGLALYIANTWTAQFQVALQLMGHAALAEGEQLVRLGGGTWGRVRLALDLPYHLARGRSVFPLLRYGGCDPVLAGPAQAAPAVAAATQSLIGEGRQLLNEASGLFAQAPRHLRTIMLPLALVEPYFRALQVTGRDVMREPADIAPLTRIGRLWLAHWRGHL